MQSFWRYNWLEQSYQYRDAFKRSVNAILLMRQLTRIVLSISRRDRNSIVTNKWFSHDQVIQRNVSESQSISQSLYWWYNWEQQSCQYQVSWRVQRWARSVDAISFDRTTDSKIVMSELRLMSLTLCCLLSRTYNAWRTESCQKYLQRLLSDLTERWVLRMRDESRKSRRFSKSDICSAIASTTSFAFNHLFSSTHRLRYMKQRDREIKIDSNSNLIVTQLAVSHQIEDRELYEVKLSKLKAADSRVIKSCFFEVIHEDDFQIFIADWLEIEKNDSRCEDHDHNDSSSHKISECEDRDHNDSLSLMNTTHEYSSWIQHMNTSLYDFNNWSNRTLSSQETSMLRRRRV